MKISSRVSRTVLMAGLIATAAAVSGCYVVPLQPPPASTAIHVPVPAPGPVTFSARLYPANDAAGAYGTVMAVVTNDLNGRGHFSTSINGENFSGEATRVAGSSRDGLANGAGSRGGYINCRYTMNSPTLGAGTCRLSNGALFTMHVGN
jgi:hypothetical protein